tara:strand:- start:6633 stop:7460 length:828 start_codon:yes stop_codon:yes gene_type:complete
MGLDDRFTKIHPTMNPPVPRSGTRTTFPGVTGGSDLDKLRAHYTWTKGDPTNFQSGDGLVPAAHTREAQFQDYVTGTQSDTLAWPGDATPWPGVATAGPEAPRPSDRWIDQGLGSLAGTAPAPSGVSQPLNFSIPGIPALGSLPGLTYTDPVTGEFVDMRPDQAMSFSGLERNSDSAGPDTFMYRAYDNYTFPDGRTVGSDPGGYPHPSTNSQNFTFGTGERYQDPSAPSHWRERSVNYNLNSLPSVPDTHYISGNPLWEFRNVSTGGTTGQRPW